MSRKRLAIFGGTFDPIHNGHLKTSLYLQANFHFDAYYFLPCNRPVLKREAMASNEQRIEMLQLALKPFNEFSLDCREIKSDAPSYMVNTLSSIRQEHPGANLVLILGYDSFITLPQWHQWEKILELANLLVMQRADYSPQSLPKPLQSLLKAHKIKDKVSFLEKQNGKIFFVDAGQHALSSTSIRAALRLNKSLPDELPKAVYAYIQAHKLYR